MHPDLAPITRPDQCYFVRNFTKWILGEDDQPLVLLVDWKFSSIVRPRTVCVGRGYFREYVPFFQLASSKEKLDALLSKWEAVRIGKEDAA